MQSQSPRNDNTVWVIGSDVSASLSPELHNEMYRRLRLPWHYSCCSIAQERVPEMLHALWRRGAIGCNVTVPYKELVFSCLSSGDASQMRLELDPAARRLGSVNTVAVHPEGLKGYSTDGAGWWQALSRDFSLESLKGRTAVLLGAGGAARALLDTILQHEAEQVLIVNRTAKRAEKMIADLDEGHRCHYAGPRWQGRLPRGSLLVQATPCRSAESLSGIWSWEGCPDSLLVSDILYGSPSALVLQAQERGLPVQDGLGMLCWQAVLAVDIWRRTALLQ
ncbi:hypothetical protein IJT17_10270 [bacterium]|nr:hypothetical protein [bacterium]